MRSQQEDVQPGGERRFQAASNVRLPQWHKPLQGRSWAQWSRSVRNHFVVVTSLAIASALVLVLALPGIDEFGGCGGDGGSRAFAAAPADMEMNVAASGGADLHAAAPILTDSQAAGLAAANADAAALAVVEPARMQGDLEFVRQTVEEVHPALLSQGARDAFEARAQAVRRQLDRPLPMFQFYSLLDGLLASVGDAHTAIALPSGDRRLPVQLKWVADGLVVTQVLPLPGRRAEERLRTGDEVVRLGGRTPDEILTELTPLISHENKYWVRAISGEYLARETILRTLGLVSPQGTVFVQVRRPSQMKAAALAASAGSQSAGSAPEGQANTQTTVVTIELPLWSSSEQPVIVAGFEEVADLQGKLHRPAQEAGLQVGDRIVVLNGQSTPTVAALAAALPRWDSANPQPVVKVVVEVARAERDTNVGAGGAPADQTSVGETPKDRVLPEERRKYVVDLVATRAEGQPEPVYRLGILRATGLETQGQRPWFGWRIDGAAGYGLFWLDDCNDTKEYRQTVDQFFAEVHRQNVRRIAIDLRHNGGGDSRVMNAFLRYLPAEVVRSYGFEARPSPQQRQQRGWVGWLETSPLARLASQVRVGRPADARLIYRGEVYVLTGWDTFSSATNMAVTLADNGLAKVVGAPSGSAPSAYGDILYFQTPNTKLQFTVSYKKFTRPAPERDPAAFLPVDVSIPMVIADVRQGRDPVLEWLAALGWGTARLPAGSVLTQHTPGGAASTATATDATSQWQASATPYLDPDIQLVGLRLGVAPGDSGLARTPIRLYAAGAYRLAFRQLPAQTEPQAHTLAVPQIAATGPYYQAGIAIDPGAALRIWRGSSTSATQAALETGCPCAADGGNSSGSTGGNMASKASSGAGGLGGKIIALGRLRWSLSLSLDYSSWPSSLVLGRAGQTGTSIGWQATAQCPAIPGRSLTVRTGWFDGTVWARPGEPHAPAARYATVAAGLRLPLTLGQAVGSGAPGQALSDSAPTQIVKGGTPRQGLGGGMPVVVLPRFSLIKGRTQAGQSFESELAAVTVRYGYWRWQGAVGRAATDGLPGFRWVLGGPGGLPLRGYAPGQFTGAQMAAFSLERHFPLPWDLYIGRLEGVLFVDAGNAWPASRGWFWPRLYWGYGGGVAFAVPQGDLQLDVAWNPAGEVRSTIGLRQIF